MVAKPAVPKPAVAGAQIIPARAIAATAVIPTWLREMGEAAYLSETVMLWLSAEPKDGGIGCERPADIAYAASEEKGLEQVDRAAAGDP